MVYCQEWSMTIHSRAIRRCTNDKLALCRLASLTGGLVCETYPPTACLHGSASAKFLTKLDARGISTSSFAPSSPSTWFPHDMIDDIQWLNKKNRNHFQKSSGGECGTLSRASEAAMSAWHRPVTVELVFRHVSKHTDALMLHHASIFHASILGYAADLSSMRQLAIPSSKSLPYGPRPCL